MTLFVSHTTAAECWRSGVFDPSIVGAFNSIGARPKGSVEVERAANMLAADRLSIFYDEALAFSSPQPRTLPTLKPSANGARALAEGKLALASGPMHLLLPSKVYENRVNKASCHICTRPLPGGSFVRIDENALLCSPELCFLQMASRLSFHALVRLGFELCALYTLQPDGTAGYDRALPITTPRTIAAYLERFEKSSGVSAARKALRYVVVASGSPMETALVIILCLPPRRGGYGLPLPCLNYRIDAPGNARSATGKSFFLCDLYWPGERVAVEYDSDQEHTGSNRISEDAQRRNDLTALGITTITATREQVMDPQGLDRLAHQIAKMLGTRIRDERGWGVRERGALFRKLVIANRANDSWTKTRRFGIPYSEF